MSVYKKLMEQTLLERPSKAAQRAKAAGLKYAEFGRWTDPSTGKVVAKSKGEGEASTLVKVKPSKDDAPKKDDDISLAKAAPKPKKDKQKKKIKPKGVGTAKKDEPVKDVPKNTEPTADEPEAEETPEQKAEKEWQEKYTSGKYKTKEVRQRAKDTESGLYPSGGKYDKMESFEREAIYKKNQQKFPGGMKTPNSDNKDLYPDGKKDVEYKKDKAAYDKQYGVPDKYESMEARQSAINKATENGKRQPDANTKDFYPQGTDDPQYKEDRQKWEDKHTGPGDKWTSSDGTVYAKDKDGRRQGWKVTDDNPENAYYADQWAAGGEIDKDKALKQMEIDKQKRVDDFEKWKAKSADEEDPEYSKGENFFAKLFGIKVPSLKDLVGGG